jgi:hypothetical protein
MSALYVHVFESVVSFHLESEEYPRKLLSSWDRCYDFKKYFLPKTLEKGAILTQSTAILVAKKGF